MDVYVIVVVHCCNLQMNKKKVFFKGNYNEN